MKHLCNEFVKEYQNLEKSAKEIGFLIGNLYKNAIKFC